MSIFRSPALLAAAWCLAVPPASAADASLQTYVRIQTSDGGSVYRTGTGDASAIVDRNGLHASATANASYGAVGVSALATAAPDQQELSITAMAGAAMEDAFSIHVNPVPLPPPPPFPTPSWSFLATVIVSGDPAMTSFETTIGGTTRRVTLHSGENEVGGTFLLGLPIRIAFTVLGETGSVGGPYQRSSEVAAGVRWGGISDVRWGTFVPSEVTVRSASGYDWALAAPIPEPPIVALLALALCAAGTRSVIRTRSTRREASHA